MISFSTIILKKSINLLLWWFSIVHNDLITNFHYSLYYPILLENITLLSLRCVFIDCHVYTMSPDFQLWKQGSGRKHQLTFPPLPSHQLLVVEFHISSSVIFAMGSTPVITIIPARHSLTTPASYTASSLPLAELTPPAHFPKWSFSLELYFLSPFMFKNRHCPYNGKVVF